MLVQKLSKVAAILLGLSVLIFLFYKAGPSRIIEQLGKMGWSIGIVLIPYSLIVYFDTLAWKCILLHSDIQQKKLLQVKLIGDTMNNIIPGGGLLGEVLKGYLLKSYGISWVMGMSSIYLSRLIMAKSQLGYIVFGLGILMVFISFQSEDWKIVLVIVLMIVLILAFLVGVYYITFKKGLMNMVLKVVQRFRWKLDFIMKQKEDLYAFDKIVFDFYKNHKRSLWLSFGYYCIGWLLGGLELYFVVFLVGLPVSWYEAMVVESLSTVVKTALFFIPGGIGVLEGGFIVLFSVFTRVSNPVEVGVLYGVIRRFREILWMGCGLVLIARSPFSFASSLKLSQEVFLRKAKNKEK